MNEPVRVAPIFGDEHEAMLSNGVIFWSPDRGDTSPSDPGDPLRRPARVSWWTRLLRIAPGTAA